MTNSAHIAAPLTAPEPGPYHPRAPDIPLADGIGPGWSAAVLKAGAPVPDDERLMALIRDGDQTAFTDLLRTHLDAVNAYLVRLTGDRHLADDLSQETFLKVWERPRAYKPGRVKVSTWLHRIAHNLAVDQFRKKREVTVEQLPQMVDPNADPQEIAVRSDAGVEVGRLLDLLPVNQRNAVVLCDLQGMSNREAARVMGVGVRAVESLLARARRHLKNHRSRTDHD